MQNDNSDTTDPKTQYTLSNQPFILSAMDTARSAVENQLNTRIEQLNDEIRGYQKTIISLKNENANLKELETSAQSMAESLLQRLEKVEN